MRWEYKCATFEVREMREPAFERRLDALGNEGWELVTLMEHARNDFAHEAYLLFRRAKASASEA